MKPTRFACATAQSALSESEAYRRFVRKTVRAIPRRISKENFSELPITSKERFIRKYPPVKLLSKKAAGAVAYASSGSSGTPSFWFRDERTVADGALLHKIILEKIYGIKRGEPTLVVVTFSMGLWVAGLFTVDACRALRADGFAVTVTAPGIDRKEGIIALKTLAPLFTHVVIAGYPPYLLDFLRDALRAWKKPHRSLFILTAGDKFSETWREEVAELIGKPRGLERVIGLYGSADAGAMAFETPASIAARRTRSLTNGGGLYQFLPEMIFFEESAGELLVTKRMPLPLVRYNIHDTGKVFDVLPAPRAAHNADFWKRLPAVSVEGRTDVAVTFYALNIYPEQIAAGIPRNGYTGSYVAFSRKRKGNYSEELVIVLELEQATRPSRAMKALAKDHVARALIASSTEYKKLHAELGAASLPHIRFVPYGGLEDRDARQKTTLVQVAGKKPRVMLHHERKRNS